ncbi:glycoside hydrolase family 3 N-terminal domain-containing protein [Prosthecomicrobium sp. N25]|uniref:glycoside hydrolase family 3 N-terminal domain-containing protein n=1 Tax=Prosthecomicrobium sp. N25 TaxID=3129254 RepID=UPI003077AD30
MTLFARAALAGLIALASLPAAAENLPSERVRRLIGMMSLEEKIGQLDMPSRGGAYDEARIAAGWAGAVLNFFTPADVARVREVNARSPLGIPLLFGLDVIHGYRTQFAVPLAEAASFDPSVAERAAYWAGVESRAAGINLTFSPVADLARDPRWGRIVEGGGEDPMLNGLFARARVEGFRRGGIASTLKHFAGYGAAEGGRDYGPADISTATLRDRYLPPYRMAVEAGVDLVMTSYVSLNGVPTTASRMLLTEILREEWGFDGYVVSDMNAVPEIVLHGFAETDSDAALMAFRAGVDQDMDGNAYAKALAAHVRAGRVPEAAIDRSVARVLAVKEKLGLFDEPPFDPAAAARVLGSPEIRRAARELARETFVLLKNDRGVLPIPPGTRTVAVVGALALDKVNPLGSNTAAAVHDDTVTILDGIKARAPRGTRVLYAEGCDLHCSTDAGFAAAARAAEQADRVVVVLGEPRDYTGEGASRASLELPGRQRDLLKRLSETGKPVAVVLLTGRPMALESAIGLAPSWLLAWYPGTEAGNAVADVLFGDHDPVGRLPVTFPRTTGQVPITYDSLPTARPGKVEDRFTSRYLDTAIGPLFPFGWGLGYAPVAYGTPVILTPILDAGQTVEVMVPVTNKGERRTREVVQLYVRDVVASRTRPLRELKAFGRVDLEPGETKDVVLKVPAENLGFHLEDGTYVVEPGRFQAFVGGSAAAPPAGEFTVRSEFRRTPARLAAQRFEAGHLTVLGSKRGQ